MLEYLTAKNITFLLTVTGMAVIIIKNWSSIFGKKANAEADLTEAQADKTAGEMALDLAREQRIYFDKKAEEVEEKLDGLMAEIVSLTKRDEESLKTIKELKGQIDKLTEKVDKLLDDVKSKDLTLKRWEEEVNRQRGIIKEKIAQISEMMDEITALEKQVATLKKLQE